MTKNEHRILTVTCFGHFLSHFNMLVFPAVLLPLSRHLNMDMADVLALSFGMYLLFGLTALPWGIAGDKWGAHPLFRVFFIGSACSGIGVAFFIDNPSMLSIALGALGLFSGIYHPVGLGWISRSVSRVSIGMAYNGIFGNLGLAGAPLMAGFMNWMWGPRAVYLLLAVLNFLGVLLLAFIPENVEEQCVPQATSETSDSFKAFLILLGAMMLGGIIYRGATVILPAYFELHTRNIFSFISSFAGGEISGNVVATTLTSIIYLVGMLGQYTGGRFAETFELRASYLLFHLVIIPIAFIIPFADNVSLVVLAMVYFFFLLGMQPIENTLVARFTPRKFHSAAYGAKFILTFGVGSLSVKMIEHIKIHFGMEYVFPAMGFVSFWLVCMILILIFQTRRLLL